MRHERFDTERATPVGGPSLELAVIVPTFNERANIEILLERLGDYYPLQGDSLYYGFDCSLLDPFPSDDFGYYLFPSDGFDYCLFLFGFDYSLRRLFPSDDFEYYPYLGLYSDLKGVHDATSLPAGWSPHHLFLSRCDMLTHACADSKLCGAARRGF